MAEPFGVATRVCNSPRTVEGTARRAKAAPTDDGAGETAPAELSGLAGDETLRRRVVTDADVDAALAALDREPLLVPAGESPSSLAGLDQPGLYSWWADQAGADALTCGLGCELPPGRIYAGLTGATKWRRRSRIVLCPCLSS